MPIPAPTTSNGPAARSALVTEVTGTPVPGGSAGELRVRDATPTVKSIPGYKYMGCYPDAYSSRILTSLAAWNNYNDPSICCEWCANQSTDFSYCGVEDETQCFCDVEEGAADQAEESECSLGCTANRDVKCGAFGYINIYSATVEIGIKSTAVVTPTVAIVPGYTHLGCMRDSSTRLLRQTFYEESVYMDAEYCCAMCINDSNDNVVCGVEYGSQCFCDGQAALTNTIRAHSTDCSVACIGHGDQLCGAAYYMNLYSATGVATTSESLSSVASASTVPHTASSTSTPKPTPSGLHGGAIAGIAVGSVAGVALIAGLAYYLWRRSRPSNPSGPAPPLPVEVAGDAKYGSPGPYELDETRGPYQLQAAPPPQAQNTVYHELQASQVPPRE